MVSANRPTTNPTFFGASGISQAKYPAGKIVRMSPALRDNVTVKDSTKELDCYGIGTHYRALSAEASTAFGLSPVFVVHDELGQVRGPRAPLYEALETATGAQENPLSVIISTQAPSDTDLLSILIEDALAGYDPRVICKLYTAGITLDPFDEETIKLANPAFGSFLNPTEVRAMADDAKRMPSREAQYRNLILNQRIEAVAQFIAPTVWAKCGAPVGDLTKCRELYGGLDLSEANDLTALVLIGKIEQSILEHILEGKFIVPSKLHSVGEPRGGLGDFVPPPRFARRSTYNDGNGRCGGQYVQDILKENRVVVGRRHHRVVFGQLVEVHPAPLYCRE
jgi:phage terminase large subunit-like protein